VSFDSIPRSFRSSLNALAANCGPLSERKLLGSPNRRYTFSSKSFPTSSSVTVFEQGMKITPFVSPWSTMDKIESYPSIIGKSVIIFIEQFANGRFNLPPWIGKNAGFVEFLLILNCWHFPHPFT